VLPGLGPCGYFPELERRDLLLIWEMLIQRGVADSGIRNRNVQVIEIQDTSGLANCQELRLIIQRLVFLFGDN
jgi:hypothetical protein